MLSPFFHAIHNAVIRWRYREGFSTFEEAHAATVRPLPHEEILQRTIENTRAYLNVPPREEILDSRSISLLFTVQTAILHSFARNGKKTISVVDYGGVLGIHYFQARGVLPADLSMKWMVVEAEDTAKAGNNFFSNQELSFISELDGVSANPDIIIAGNSLQYSADPYAVLSTFKSIAPLFIILDHLPLSNHPRHRPMVEKDSPFHPSQENPVWIFSRDLFLEKLEEMNLTIRLQCHEGMEHPLLGAGGHSSLLLCRE